MKNLVVCGNCEIKGGTTVKKWIGSGFNVELKRPGAMVLGEVTNEGDFLIKRGGQNYTMIMGESFIVLCGNCNEPVYRKEVYGTTVTPGFIGSNVLNYIQYGWSYAKTTGSTGTGAQEGTN